MFCFWKRSNYNQNGDKKITKKTTLNRVLTTLSPQKHIGNSILKFSGKKLTIKAFQKRFIYSEHFIEEEKIFNDLLAEMWPVCVLNIEFLKNIDENLKNDYLSEIWWV